MSPFIERLGWVLIHSLWQLALLAAAAFVVQRAMQRTSAAARYAVLLGMLGMVVAAPLITWSVLPVRAALPVAEKPAAVPALASVPAPKTETVAPVIAPSPVTVESTPPIASVTPAPPEPFVPAALPEPVEPTWSEWVQRGITPWLSTIVWGWSLGVLAFAIRPLWSWFTVRQLRTQGVSPVSASVQAALAETARRLGVTQAVRVLQSTIVQVPVVAGYLKPVILLPASIVTGLPASQLEAILAHELAHIRRHDYLANLIQTLVETVFFYHPAVWWLSHQIRSERENCCDDIAVAMLGNRLDYSRALLAVEELRGSPTTLAVGASGGSLLGRVKRLFHLEAKQRSLSNGSIALGALLILVTLSVVGVAITRGENDKLTEPDEMGWKIEIPDHGTFELAQLHRDDGLCWTPDGRRIPLLPERSFNIQKIQRRGMAIKRQFGLSFLYSGERYLEDADTSLSGRMDDVWQMKIKRMVKGDLNEVVCQSTSIIEDNNHALSKDVVLDLSFDPWREWITIDKNTEQPEPTQGLLRNVRIRRYGSGESAAFLYENAVGSHVQVQVKVIDLSDREITAGSASIKPNEGMISIPVPFSSVKEVKYRVRWFTHEVLIRDVSLDPGHETHPRISVKALDVPDRPESLSFASPAADATSWPQLGGSPTRNPVSPVTNLPLQFDLAKKENIRWSAPIGDFTFNSPVISGGKVLIGTNNGSGRDPRFPASVDIACLQCFDERTGEFLWQFGSERLGKAATHQFQDWPSLGLAGTPCVEGDRVWLTTNRCELVCLDLQGFQDNGEDDGEPEASTPGDSSSVAHLHLADVVWKFDMRQKLGVQPMNATCGSPVVAGDLVLVNTSNDVDDSHQNVAAPDAPSFIALSKATGELIWSSNAPGRNILGGGCSGASPAVARIDGTWQAIFPGLDGWLYAYDLTAIRQGRTELLWKFDCNHKDSVWTLEGKSKRGMPTTPVIWDDKVLVAIGRNPENGEGAGFLWCIDATKNGDISSELVYNKSAPDVVIPPKRIRACEPDKGDFTRRNPNSGVVWSYQGLGAEVDGVMPFENLLHRAISHPAVHDEFVIVSDLSGVVHCVDAATGKGLWTHDSFAASWSSPLIADGKIWVTDEDGDLSVFALADQKQLLAEHNFNSPAYGSPAAANQTLYVATKTQLVAIGRGAFPDPQDEEAAWDELEALKVGLTGGGEAGSWLQSRFHYRSIAAQLNERQRTQMRKDLRIDKLPAQATISNVPPEAWPKISRLGSLTDLSLMGSDLRGQLHHLAPLKGLRRLSLSFSKVLPSDLVALESLINLEELDVTFTVFDEPRENLDAEIGSLTDAEKNAYQDLLADPGKDHLLRAAVLTDRAFEHLQHLSQLRTLRFINTVVSGVTIERLQRHPKLERLELVAVSCPFQKYEVLKQLPELRELSWVPFGSHEVLPTILQLQHLEKIFRGAEDLTDEGTKQLVKVRTLKSLVLWNAQITDVGLMKLTELPLELLDVRFVKGITAEGVQRFRQKCATCRVIYTDEDLTLSSEIPKSDGLVAKLPGGQEIELVGITPNAAPTTEGWRADGSPIEGAGDWPRGATFARDGDRITMTTDTATKLKPDPQARDILFECRGATSSPSWTVFRQSGLGEFQTLGSDAGLRKRLTLSRKDKALKTTVEMAYTDSPWGPWQRVDASGQRIDVIETFAPDQKLYGEMQIVRLAQSENKSDQGSPLELVLSEPAVSDEYFSAIFNVEVRFVDKNQKAWNTYPRPEPMKNGRRTVTWTTGGPVPHESLAYAEFRLRPYRHFITFENVPLEKSAAGKTTVKHRSIPEPPRRTADNRFVARLSDGLEIELLRIVRNDLPVEQNWLPNGEVPTSVIDWPNRSFFKVNENSVSSSNDGPGSDRVWDFAYAYRPTATPPLMSVEYGDGSSYSATSLGQLGLRTIALAPKDPAQLTKFQMRVGTEPWGQWIQVGADGKHLNPEAINKKSNSPDPLIWIAGAGIDEDNPDRSWFKWMALPHANQLYSMEVRAIDDDGQSHQSNNRAQRVTAATMHEITQWFDLPVEKLNRFEYRMRPYRHLVTYDNICTDPKKPTEVRVSVEPIVYPNEAAVEKSCLLVLNPDNTPWQGSLVAGHIGFIPPDAKAWNAWVGKDGQADLSALPVGQHWLISRFPWSVIPVETPLRQTVRQPLRLGTPPKKHSSSNYSGNLSVQRDEQGREFIQCDFSNNTDELWSFSELDLTLESGWFSTESHGRSPQWLGDRLTEVPQIEIPPGQKGSLRIDWSEWVKRGVWDPMSGPQAVSKPVLPDQEPGKIWVRISGPGFGTNPVAVTHPDELLAVSDEPVPQPPAPDEVDGPRVNLVGLTWDRVPKNDAWEPNGNPMPVPDWAKTIIQLLSAEMSDIPVLLYEIHGLKGTPSINFHESSITTGDQQLTGSVFRQAQLRLRTRDEYRNVPPKVSISDEPWGPWRTITKSGEMAGPVPEDSAYRLGYAMVTAHGVRPLQRNAQVQGLILQHPKAFRDLYDFEIEEVWLSPLIGPSDIYQGDSAPVGEGENARVEIEYPLPSHDDLKEYRYRIRPYRHQFVFENVNYAPSQNPTNYTPFKTVYTKLEYDLPNPVDVSRLQATLPGGRELELLGVTPFREPGKESWTPYGKKFDPAPDWASRFKLEPLPPGGMSDSSNEDYRDFIVRARGFSPEQLALLPFLEKFESDDSTIGRMQVLTWNQQVQRLRIGIPGEWGPYRVLTADPKVPPKARSVNPPGEVPAAYRKVYDSIQLQLEASDAREERWGKPLMKSLPPDFTFTPGAPDPDFEPGSRVRLVWKGSPTNPDLMYATHEAVVIDMEGKPHQVVATSAFIEPEGGHQWDVEIFDVPISKVSHVEYRLRPYQQVVTFNNVALHPGVECGPNVVVESPLDEAGTAKASTTPSGGANPKLAAKPEQKPQPPLFTFEPVEGRVLLPNGQPAAEVPVVLRRMPWGQHLLPQQVEKEPEDPHDLTHTVTDAQGRFAFRDVPIPELYRDRDEIKLDVVAKLDSHAVAWSRVIVATPVTLTLQPEAKLTGKITGPSGQPVAGAVIQAAWIMSLRHITQADLEEGRWPSWKDRSFVGLTDCQLVPKAKTNENGEFTLSGLPRGLGMRLFVRSEDFEPQWFDAATAAIEGENLRLAKRPVASGPLTIRMQTPREHLTIRVVDDATGAPLEGAKVIAHPSGQLPVSQTGNESVFRLAAGDVSISAELPIEKGYLRGWGLFEAGQAQNAEIRLKRGIPLRGRVIDQETKQPLAGIEVRVDGRLEEIQIGNACLWSKTGNDGSFDLLLSQGKHIAWVRPFKSIYRNVGVSMLDGQFGVMAHHSATIDTNQLPDTLELALERAQGIEGVVLDPQGELGAGVQYRGLYKGQYGAQSFGDVTTEQGEFVISEPFGAEPLARSIPLDVLFWDEQRGLVGTLRVDPVVPSVAHEVELQPAGQVTGRVVDDQGRPVAHALVQCGLMFPSFTRQTGAVIARPVRTSEDGRFEIRSGVAGYRLALEVDRPGYVRAWKALSLAKTEQDKDLGEIVLEIEKPVQKLTVELPKLQGLTPEAQYTALSGSFDSLVQQVDATRKVARNYDVVPDNTSQSYAQAMWDVAQSARAGDVERKALVWMVGMRRLSGNHGAEYEKLRQQAGARLIEAYADQPDVAAVADSVAWTQYSLPEGTHRAALVFLEKSPDRSARGICCLLAAESLVDRGPVRSRPIAPETISRVEPLLKRVVSEFADLPHADDWRKGTLGECAQGWLETLLQVQQGVAVPDMVWKDSLGQPLRISDLQGKVVVLDHGTLSDDSFSRTLLNQAGPNRVIVIQVSAQNVETAWKALDGLAVPRRQISYEEANRFERMWNIRTWPGAIVLNEQGGVAGEDLREKLPEVLSSVLKSKAAVAIAPRQAAAPGADASDSIQVQSPELGEWGETTDGLRSRLQLIRDPSLKSDTSRKVGSPVEVALEIENVSQAEKQLSVSTVFSLDDVQITGPDGKPCPDVRGPLSIQVRQITIPPGETKAVIERADLTEQFLMTEPGEYRIRAKSPTVSNELSSGELRITLAEGEVSPIRRVYRDVVAKAPTGSLLLVVKDQLWVFVSGQTKSTDPNGNPVIKLWHRKDSVPAEELPQGAVELKVLGGSGHWYAEVPAGVTPQWKTVERDLLNVCQAVAATAANRSPRTSSGEDASEIRPILIPELGLWGVSATADEVLAQGVTRTPPVPGGVRIIAIEPGGYIDLQVQAGKLKFAVGEVIHSVAARDVTAAKDVSRNILATRREGHSGFFIGTASAKGQGRFGVEFSDLLTDPQTGQLKLPPLAFHVVAANAINEPVDESGHTWFLIGGDFSSKRFENVHKNWDHLKLPVEKTVGDKRLGLVGDSAATSIPWDGSWHVEKCELSADPNHQNQFQIDVTVDSHGGELLRKLTTDHPGEQMAVVVEERIVLAPTIRSVIGNRFSITGKFTKVEGEQLVQAIRRGMKPAVSKAEDADPQKPWRAKGRVVDGNGKPLADVTVRAATGMGTLLGGGSGTTDADGRYDFRFGLGIQMGKQPDGKPSPQTQSALISAQLEGHFEKNFNRQGNGIGSLEPVTDEVAKQYGVEPNQIVLPNKPREVDFVMLPAARVAGTLVGENDQPLKDYSVMLTGEMLPSGAEVIAQVKTDEKGRFEIKDIPTTVPYQVEIRKPTAELMPPWDDTWASRPMKFLPPGEHDIAWSMGDQRLFTAKSFSMKIQGPGGIGEKVLKLARSAPASDSKSVVIDGREHRVQSIEMNFNAYVLTLTNEESHPEVKDSKEQGAISPSAIPAPAAAEAALPPPRERVVSLKLKQVTRREALEKIAAATQLQLVVEEEALSKTDLDLSHRIDLDIEAESLWRAVAEVCDFPQVITRGAFATIRKDSLVVTTLDADLVRRIGSTPDWLRDSRNSGVNGISDGEGHVSELHISRQGPSAEALKQIPQLPHLKQITFDARWAASDEALSELALLPTVETVAINSGEARSHHADRLMTILKFYPHLREINFFESGVSDEGISHLSESTTIESISIYQDGRVTDLGIEKIAAMPQLKTLRIQQYVFTDKWPRMTYSPEVLQKLSQLEYLEHLALDGIDSPATLVLPRGLKSLAVSGQAVDDDFAGRIAGCSNLRTLNLRSTSITDAGLRKIALGTKLTNLSLSESPITDEGISHLVYLPLESIELRGVSLGDQALVYLSQLTTLRSITLSAIRPASTSGSAMTVAGLSCLKELPKLQRLWISNFPTSADYTVLRDLTQLRELNMEMNPTDANQLKALQLALPRTTIQAGTGGGWIGGVP